jgi:Rrf2 family protein
MRISAKGRYALAAAVTMAQQYQTGEQITLISISEKLGISKIYLEQVFSLLKRGELVYSIKGAQGGYKLSRAPRQITALDILSAVEISLFDRTETTVTDKAPQIEYAMRSRAFDPLDRSVSDALSAVSLKDLADTAERHKADSAPMFYI